MAPTAAFFFAAKFLPALLAPMLTARIDQLSVRRSLPALYVLEALVFAALALIADGDFVLVARARARAGRRGARADGRAP